MNLQLSQLSTVTNSKAFQYSALTVSVVGSQAAVSCVSNKRRWIKVALSTAAALIGAVVF